MSYKVLVADDSGVMRKIIIRALNAEGVQDIVEAADGAQALAAYNAGGIALVLTDWNMPNMTGIEFVKALREAGSTTPVILITTESERSRVVEAIQAGINDFLAKPFEASVLREKLTKFLPAGIC